MAHGQIEDNATLDYYDLPVDIKNKGFLYEQALFHKLKDASLVPQGFSPAGSDNLAPDLKFIWHGNEYNLEVKLDQKADYGQSGLRYVDDTWILDGSSAQAHVSMREMLTEIGIPRFVNSVDGWGGLGQPRKFLREEQGLKTSVSDHDYDYNTFLDKYIKIDSNTVSRYYNNKNIYYIHIGGMGTYYMGKDPAQMARSTDMAKFIPSLKLRIRKKGSSDHSKPYRFSLALLVDNKPLASNFDMSVDAHIHQLTMNIKPT